MYGDGLGGDVNKEYEGRLLVSRGLKCVLLRLILLITIESEMKCLINEMY